MKNLDLYKLHQHFLPETKDKLANTRRSGKTTAKIYEVIGEIWNETPLIVCIIKYFQDTAHLQQNMRYHFMKNWIWLNINKLGEMTAIYENSRSKILIITESNLTKDRIMGYKNYAVVDFVDY